jgi:outer membrane protein
MTVRRTIIPVRTILAGALAAAAFEAAAQTASAPALPDHPLTAQECVNWALDRGPEYRSAAQRAAGASEAAASAKAPYWPGLSFSTSYSRWQRRIFLPNELSLPGLAPPELVGPTDDGAWSFTTSYTLFDGGERRARLKAAQAHAGAAEASREEARQTVALNVETAYFACASAQQVLRVAEEGLRRAQDHLRLASERKAVGAVPLLDVLRAQVAVSDARVSLVAAQGALRTARGALATAMGLPAESPLEIAPDASEPEAPDASGLIAALDAGAAQRAAVKAAQDGVEAARRGVDAAKSAWSPKVVAFGSWGREDAAWLPQDQTWSAGVALSLPIFTGFSRVHEVARAKADLAVAEAQRDQALLVARQQGWEAFSAYQEAYERARACVDLVAQAKESHRMAKERYAVGAGTLTDLLDAETALAHAEASKVSAEWSTRAARARYLWSLGRLVER